MYTIFRGTENLDSSRLAGHQTVSGMSYTGRALGLVNFSVLNYRMEKSFFGFLWGFYNPFKSKNEGKQKHPSEASVRISSGS